MSSMQHEVGSWGKVFLTPTSKGWELERPKLVSVLQEVTMMRSIRNIGIRWQHNEIF